MQRQRLLVFLCLGLVLAGAGVGLLVLLLGRAPVANAEFTLEPLVADRSGIEPTTGFRLTSSKGVDRATLNEVLESDPPIDFKIAKKNVEGTVFELTPRNELDHDQLYQLWIDQEATDTREYRWAYQVKAPFQVVGSSPRNESTYVPTSASIAIRFNREGLKDPAKYFSIEPNVAGRFETNFETLTFIPEKPLNEQTIYRVTVKKGLPLTESDEQLTAEYTALFETDRAKTETSQPELSMDDLVEIRPDATPLFGLNIWNWNNQAQEAQVTVGRFASADEFIQTWSAEHDPKIAWSSYAVDKTHVDISKLAQTYKGSVPLENQDGTYLLRLPEKLSGGLYLLDVSIAGLREQAWLAVTPVTYYAAVTKNDSAFWIKDSQTGQPVVGRTVRLGTAEAETDSQGLVTIPTPNPLPDARFALLEMPTYMLPLALGEPDSTRQVTRTQTWHATTSTDKTIYQPSDTIRFWSFLKPETGELGREELQVELATTEWAWDESAVKVLAKTKVTATDFGTIIGSLPFKNVPPGYYQLRIKRGGEVVTSTSINVEVFQKPGYQISVSPDRIAAFHNDEIQFRVKASFFDGTPVSNLKVLVPEANDESPSRPLTLDQNGEGTFSFRVKNTCYEFASWCYGGVEVTPAVAEEGEIRGQTSLLAFPGRYHLQELNEYRADEVKLRYKLQELKIGDVTMENVSNDALYLGPAIADHPVEMTVKEIRYTQRQTGQEYDPISQTTRPIYTYDREEQQVAHETARSSADGLVEFTQKLGEGRSYTVETVVKDPEGRSTKVSTYAYGSRAANAERLRNVSVETEGDKSEWGLDETVQLKMVDDAGQLVPDAADAFLFISYRDGIREARVQSSSRYETTFAAADVPNFLVTGAWWDGNRFYSSGIYGTSAFVSYNQLERELKIDLTNKKERYRPGERVELRVAVTDKKDNPRSVEVLAGALDEAVFTVNPETRDPLAELYQDRAYVLISRSSHKSPVAGGAEGGGCFVAGTLIRMADGSHKPIEEIRPGETVLAANPSTGAQEPALVKSLIRYESLAYLVINDSLRITRNHPLATPDGWQNAGELRVGDQIMGLDGSHEVKKIETVTARLPVFNLDVTGPSTYFADGYLVHNAEKDGGGVRDDLEDVATWQTIRTGRDGVGNLSFTLPDNITSWRLNLVAVSQDLYLGTRTEFLPVGLPFFVDASLNTNYLAGDNLRVRLRAFGDKVAEPVTYRIRSKFLPGGQVEKIGTRVEELDLGKLPGGLHRLEISAQSGELKDTLIRTINVQSSYLVGQTSTSLPVVAGPLALPASAGRMEITFVDAGRAEFLDDLRRLATSSGLRFDQVAVRAQAEKMLSMLYPERSAAEPPDLSAYQKDGGITLFPYSDPDLELSVATSLVGSLPAGIDAGSLRGYFETSLIDAKSDYSRRLRGLVGLSALGRPAITQLRFLEPDLKEPADKIYYALGLERAGAKEDARAYFTKELSPLIETHARSSFLSKARSEDERRVLTALLGLLATRLDVAEAPGLQAYALSELPKATLTTLQQLTIVEETLRRAPTNPASITLVANGEEETWRFPEGQPLSRSFGETPTITISESQGNLRAIVEREAPLESLQGTSSHLKISRKYVVDGRETTSFANGDLVRIELLPEVTTGALGNDYILTDFLPSGLRPTERRPRDVSQSSETRVFAPTVLEGQRATFNYHTASPGPIIYYARAVSTGTFTAEAATLSARSNPDARGVGTPTQLTIN